MALLLSLETSTATFSVAIHENGHQLHISYGAEPQSTASQLAVQIERILKESNRQANQIDGVVVASGPGSYTGLRIGVATAKGICYALQIPLIAVNTLELMAFQAKENFSKADLEENIRQQALLCPMLDARRMEVYCMLTDFNLHTISPTQAKIIEHTSFQDMLARKIFFFGEGAEKCKTVIQHPKADFIENIKPSAGALGIVGNAKFEYAQFEDLTSFEPFYLKDFLIRKPNPA